ncbi:unnamed protein product [Didymodactylos carnosus]|uniref:GPI ethanolamine phosphate transferase 1 n=1 Tax=Didymodactylos carnosus TaxID=1234261 RepID=A0A8S2GI05_9BILA|nr:unnamed protein product [Didymodactylos carnosus]CAF3520565.1 unnamed protein product [Didymodactylos carnosus]
MVIYTAIVTHFILFYSIFDVYFTSPLTHGMPPHRSTTIPPSKRLVLIVADGLRADKFYDFKYAPYLHSIINNQPSISGISHTRVPTESRPGHVAIISGFYEDISAVTRGWKENPIEFDSVFNRSLSTFGFGSPDIVPMFKRGLTYEHFYLECYDHEREEFGRNNSYELDLWVEEKFKEFLLNKSNSYKQELDQSGIVFFFHLLGIDTNGHSHKPWSFNYLQNIQIVDEIVQRLVILIESYYSHDQKTTYLFTSDHGMTDWGSHGSGDDTETLTPVVLWGSGIHQTRKNIHVEQADLCPLMAYLLGLEYPVNSVGQLPVDYLYPTDEHLLKAYLQNARQLLEQVHVQKQELMKRLINFKIYPLLTDDDENIFFTQMDRLLKTGG